MSKQHLQAKIWGTQEKQSVSGARGTAYPAGADLANKVSSARMDALLALSGEPLFDFPFLVGDFVRIRENGPKTQGFVGMGGEVTGLVLEGGEVCYRVRITSTMSFKFPASALELDMSDSLLLPEAFLDEFWGPKHH